jgi:hypothetical protein
MTMKSGSEAEKPMVQLQAMRFAFMFVVSVYTVARETDVS